MSSTRAVVAWSGGKDCTLALDRALDSADVEPVALLTTAGEDSGRVGHHGVRVGLVERQAEALGLPLTVVWLPADCSNETYETHMAETMDTLRADGVRACVFGDVALEEVRAYREDRLEDTGITPSFPLWGTDTGTVAEAFLNAGYRATVVAVDRSVLDRSVVGRPYDRSFLDTLPAKVDPAGENGEFHTFVHDGPIFDRPVAATVGETVERELDGARYAYADIE